MTRGCSNVALDTMQGMSQRKVTIRDLARDLHLSVGSVSNALNGNVGQVSPATVRRVLDAAERLGYTKNRAARSLKTGRQNAVSLYVPNVVRSLNFYMDFMLGVVEATSEAQLDLVLTSDTTGQPQATLVDGAIIIDWLPRQVVPPLLSHGNMPVVTAGRVSNPELKTATTVRVDYVELAAEMVSAAVEAGAERVAMLAPDSGFDSDWAASTELGARLASETLGVSFDVERISVAADAPEVLAAATGIAARHNPDLVVFGPQRFAGIVTPVLGWGRSGSSVPYVISCAGDPVSELSSPDITAIDASPRDFGRECATELIALIREAAPIDSENTPRVVTHEARIHWATHWAPAPQISGAGATPPRK